MVLQFAPVSSDGCELPLSSHGLPASYVPCLSMVRDLFRVPVPPLLSPLLEPPPRPSFFVHCCELLVHCRKLLAGKALNDSASSDTQSPSIIQIIPILSGTVTMKPAFSCNSTILQTETGCLSLARFPRMPWELARPKPQATE